MKMAKEEVMKISMSKSAAKRNMKAASEMAKSGENESGKEKISIMA
jgi:hypothetical protein